MALDNDLLTLAHPASLPQYFADEFSAKVTQTREDVIDIVDGKHDAPYTERVHWCVLWLSFDSRRCVELGQLKPIVSVRGPHHRHLALNVLKSNDKVHPGISPSSSIPSSTKNAFAASRPAFAVHL